MEAYITSTDALADDGNYILLIKHIDDEDSPTNLCSSHLQKPLYYHGPLLEISGMSPEHKCHPTYILSQRADLLNQHSYALV